MITQRWPRTTLWITKILKDCSGSVWTLLRAKPKYFRITQGDVQILNNCLINHQSTRGSSKNHQITHKDHPKNHRSTQESLKEPPKYSRITKEINQLLKCCSRNHQSVKESLKKTLKSLKITYGIPKILIDHSMNRNMEFPKKKKKKALNIP